MKIPDLSHADSFSQGFPHEVFRTLRREQPVAWHEGDRFGGPGFWVITKHEDIRTIGKNPILFSSNQGTNIEDPDARQREEGGLQAPVLLDMDPPEHVRYRKLVNAGFTPRQIAQLQSHSEKLVKDILDRATPLGACDFVTDIAAELPLQVIGELLGVPHEDRHKIFDWSNRMIGREDPEYQTAEGEEMRAAAEMFLYAHGQAEQRLEAPRGDLMSAILHGEVDGQRISMAEFDAFFLILAIAGNETTRNMISHGLLLLLDHPEQKQRLIDDASLIPNAVEEMLRYRPPVMYFRRTVTADTELRGVKLRQGDKVTLWYPSANRDEEIFEDPDRFDITRKPNNHLSFGVGEHFCLGTHLARQEIREMFRQLLTRMPDIEIAGDIEYLRSHFIDGVKHIPIKYSTSDR
ncbi:cytochrome P450 [Myxococcota bacterium]|nr:cytochrome P450 [Myxococcota bacterium]